MNFAKCLRAAALALLCFGDVPALAQTPSNLIGLATVQAMVSLGVAAPQYPNVQTYGYYAVNDAAGPEKFKWTAPCPGSANVVNYIAATGVSSGCYVLQQVAGAYLTSGIAGARCNGSTNDTTRINALLAAASITTKRWEISSGTCLSDPITWSSYSNMIGHIATGATLKQNSSSNNFLNMFPGDHNTLIVDGTIDCGAVAFANSMCVVLAQNNDTLTGSGTGWIKNCYNICLQLGAGQDNQTVSNINIGVSYGIGMGTNGVPTANTTGLRLSNIKCDHSTMVAAAATTCFGFHYSTGTGTGTYFASNVLVNNLLAILPESASVTPGSLGFECWGCRGDLTNIHATGGDFGISLFAFVGTLVSSSSTGAVSFSIECANCFAGPTALSGLVVDGDGVASPAGVVYDDNTGSSHVGVATVSGVTVKNTGNLGPAFVTQVGGVSFTGSFAYSGGECVESNTVNIVTIVGMTCSNVAANGPAGIVVIEGSTANVTANNVNWVGNAIQFVASLGPTRDFLICTSNIAIGTINNGCLYTGANFGANVVTANNTP